MSARAARWGCLGFAAISGAIAFNVLVLQARDAPDAFKARIRAAIQEAESNRVGNAAPDRAGKPRRLEPTSYTPHDRTHDDAGAPAPELVRTLQRRLSVAGYEPGSLDGTLGDITRAAILAYEHDYDLALTATPSRALIEHLEGARPEAGARRHERTALTTEAARLVRQVQTSLAALGYSVGPIDGGLSIGLEAAIRAFEMQHALVPSGRISGELVQRLMRVAASPGARTRARAEPRH
jgi:hypothetical protein